MRLVCCFVVRFSPSARGDSGSGDIPGRGGHCQLHLGVGVASRRHPGARLALPPSFPAWGLDPLRRETSAATVAIHASGGRCSTRPCAHAIDPSSFSAVRRQVWLGGLALTRTTPVGRRAVRRPHSCTCAARFYADCRACAIGKFHWVGLRSSSSHVCAASCRFRLICWLGGVGSGGRWAGFSSAGCLWLIRSWFISFVC